VLKKILVVSCLVAGLAPVQAHAISISDSFDFGLETDGPCFPNVATVDGTDIDVLVTSADGLSEGFGPLLGFDPDSHQTIRFVTGNDDCSGDPISMSVCLVDQRPNPSAINKFLRTLGETHQWNPWELFDVTFISTDDGTFTSIDDGTSVSFLGESLDLVISSAGTTFGGVVYLYLGPCSPPTISFDDIDLSHYLNRVPVEEAVSLPDTGSSSILSGLFVSMAFVIFGFTLMVVSRRTRQTGSA
jgi:hypothetical protein